MTDLPDTRQTLLLRLGQKSQGAWHEFLAAYEDAIVRYCVKKGLQEADARDVTQEVLVAVHEKVASWDFSSQGSFRGWVFQVARNTVVDCLRARAARVQPSGDTHAWRLLSELEDPQLSIDQEFWTEYRRTLFRVVARRVRKEVREATWQAFWRTAVQGEKSDAVASSLGVPVGSVYTAKCRVMDRIRRCVADLDDVDSADLDKSSTSDPSME